MGWGLSSYASPPFLPWVGVYLPMLVHLTPLFFTPVQHAMETEYDPLDVMQELLDNHA